jgi:hypothetical protein
MVAAIEDTRVSYAILADQVIGEGIGYRRLRIAGSQTNDVLRPSSVLQFLYDFTVHKLEVI